jgi:poly-gamma-glutamate synthesis protein (capsule biosynthesis protein)
MAGPARVTLGFVGDLMFGPRTRAAALAGAPERVWGDVLPLLRAADGVIANLECPLTRAMAPWARSWKTVKMRGDPETVGLLQAANIRCVSFANNHTLDYQDAGLRETLDVLRGAGIAQAGAGRDAAAAAAPAWFDVAGLRIAAIALTDNMRAYGAGPERPGTNHARIDDATLARVGAQVAALKADRSRHGADLVIASVHWGPNLRWWPPQRFRRFARGLIERGVDIFHGHSAHVLQPVEVHGRGIILYDTGDFVDGVWWIPAVPRYPACLFLVDVVDAKPQGLRAVPLVLEPGRVRRARGPFTQRVVARLLRLPDLASAAGSDRSGITVALADTPGV